jgi:hypothetical protein
LKRRRIPAVWQLLKDNILAHRKRKGQDEDDIMICHCKPTWRGGDGCGPDCINRMLCIECVPVRVEELKREDGVVKAARWVFCSASVRLLAPGCPRPLAMPA